MIAETGRKMAAETMALQFVLRGFSELVGTRVFTFEGVAADRTRSTFTVSANLAMTRRYGIRLQELPLLCRGVLEHSYDGGANHDVLYTEELMRVYADNITARDAAAKLRRPPRRPAPEQNGAAWRGAPR